MNERVKVFLKLKAKEIGVFLLALGGVGAIYVCIVFTFMWVKDSLPTLVGLLPYILLTIGALALLGLFILIIVSFYKWIKSNWEEAGEIVKIKSRGVR